jgi:hypothetical protein
VLTSIEARLDDTVPAKRSITLDDLVTLRLGFGSVMAPPDTYPIQIRRERVRARDPRTADPAEPPDIRRMDQAFRNPSIDGAAR